MTEAYLALSPLDGRYLKHMKLLCPLFSEAGLIQHRLKVEINWLIMLSDQPDIKEVPALSDQARHYLHALLTQPPESTAKKVKTIEATTNHDVKAVEYYLKEACAQEAELDAVKEFVHFGCTSEDINNLAYALMVKRGRDEIILPLLASIASTLREYAHQYADVPMLSRTHGQAASPTTLGKEWANVLHRLQGQVDAFSHLKISGKFNGAVGNYNAHYAAYPHVNWPEISRRFIESFGLSSNAYTTQIEPHDNLAEYLHGLIRINTIFIDMCRDIWGYIALDYLKQKPKPGEVGSSTMPHKVNPIDFENAEGNLGLANSLMSHLAQKLPCSRWQRDLTDSTVLRNVGVALGYSVLAYESIKKGFSKLDVNLDTIQHDLATRYEVLAEPVQTIMRRYGIEKPYEKLKALTRGQAIEAATLRTFIEDLELPEEAKQQLLALTPACYLGWAKRAAQAI